MSSSLLSTTTSSTQHDVVARYLDSFTTNNTNTNTNTNPRTPCCGTSRWLYCPECYRLLIEERHWPEELRSGSDTALLPFALDVLLHDRRNSSTGVQLMVLDHAKQQQNSERNDDANDSNGDHEVGSDSTIPSIPLVRLVDIDRDEPLPNYHHNNKANNSNDGDDDYGNTFLLFPTATSVPLSSVAHKIERLVVLDVKWTRSSLRLHPSLSSLPTVHLTSPPPSSFFWRWHNAGTGMLSTIEAVRVAATEVDQTNRENNRSNGDSCQRNDYLYLLWLFGLQRAVISNKQKKTKNTAAPFTEQGKEQARALRKRKDTNGDDSNGKDDNMKPASKEGPSPKGNKGKGPRPPRWASVLQDRDTE